MPYIDFNNKSDKTMNFNIYRPGLMVKTLSQYLFAFLLCVSFFNGIWPAYAQKTFSKNTIFIIDDKQKHTIQRLTKIVLQGESIKAEAAAKRLHEKNIEMLRYYPEVSPKMLARSRGSIGLSLFRLEFDIEKVINVLITEGWLGNIESQKILNRIFFYRDLPKNLQERIVAYYQETADMGVKYSHFALGKIYLKGSCRPKSIEKAHQHFEKASMSSGYNQLGLYYLQDVEDIDKAQFYFDIAAQQTL